MIIENKRFVKATTPNEVYAFINLTKLLIIVFIVLHEHKLSFYCQRITVAYTN